MKIRLVGAELFHADGHDENNSRFSKFCERASKPVSERNVRIRVTFFLSFLHFFVLVYHNFLSELSRCNYTNKLHCLFIALRRKIFVIYSPHVNVNCLSFWRVKIWSWLIFIYSMQLVSTRWLRNARAT